MVKKKAVLIVAIMFLCFCGIVSAKEGNEKTYTLDEVLERISLHKPYTGLIISDNAIYEVVIKYFPNPDTTITESEYWSLVNELKEYDQQARQQVAQKLQGLQAKTLLGCLLLVVILFFFLFILR